MKNIIADILVILAVILLGSMGLFGMDTELNRLWKQDIGSIICTFGVVWLIASALRICTNFTEWFASLACAFGVFVFGFILSDYGFFSAGVALGCYLLFVAYLTCTTFPHITRRAIIISVILLAICLPLKRFDSPTCPPKKPMSCEEFTDVYDM